MPKNKDQKRLVRARMKKTGESYTAARSVVVAKNTSKPQYAAPRSQWPTLAGVADARVHEKTGRTWAQWVELLDSEQAHLKSHRDIAKSLGSQPEVSAWWAQTVAVGYERIRGLREVGQKRSGSFEASKSRTCAVEVSRLYRMFADKRNRKKWLPEGSVLKVRGNSKDKSIRWDWHDGSQVNVMFTAKGPDKSSVTVMQVKLTSKDHGERVKAFWSEHLAQLKVLLE